MIKSYVADFETTTDPEDCRVWAWGLCDLKSENIVIDNSIETFIDYISKMKTEIYFHNLKFDGEFILSYLLDNGFEYTHKKKMEDKTFTTLISDTGQFYSLKIMFDRNKNYKTEIKDSLKLLPMSVSEIAKSFGLKENKGTIDYNKFRPVNYVITMEEREYLRLDLIIVTKALQELFSQNLTKLTTSSNALNNYKEILKGRRFEYWYPVNLNIDYFCRKSYKGGWTYCNDKFKEKEIGEGIVFDVNSLYPSVMFNSVLPYGDPIHYWGKYKKDKHYTLYIQKIRCSFEIKKDYLPTIQIKNGLFFKSTEYLKSSNNEDVVLYLTSVDLKLFLDHYDVYSIEYLEGFKFKGSDQLFKKYVEYWNSVKVNASVNKNAGLRTIAKLMMNGLYGKFATNPQCQSKIPYLDENGVVSYHMGEIEERDPIYVPVASFITSYARQVTIRTAQSVYDRFIYADTDSIHLIGTEIPDIDIHSSRLGAWKQENTFVRGRFLRAKSYVEEVEHSRKEIIKMILNKSFNKNLLRLDMKKGKYYYLHITCAGMPTSVYKNVTWDNFKVGSVFDGKLKQIKVKGGVVLQDIEYSIRK